MLITDTPYPHLLVTMGGNDAFRAPVDMEAEEFVGVKGFKARGKRVTTFAVERVEELEPTRTPNPDEQEVVSEDTVSQALEDAEASADTEDKMESQQDVLDEVTGQLHIFDD